jgi:hypothetical protein
MRPNLDQLNAFLAHKPLPGIAHEHNAHVRVIGGEHTGDAGSLISIETLGDDPVYLVELESNIDALIPQSFLQTFKA